MDDAKAAAKDAEPWKGPMARRGSVALREEVSKALHLLDSIENGSVLVGPHVVVANGGAPA